MCLARSVPDRGANPRRAFLPSTQSVNNADSASEQAATPARRFRGSSATLRSPPGGCRMRWRPQSSSASAPCRRVGAAPKVRTPFRAFWRVGGTPVGDLSRPSASRLALRSASPDAASYTTFDPSFDTTFAVMPRAGLSNGLSPGSKSAAACGRTASENSIPACSSST